MRQILSKLVPGVITALKFMCLNYWWFSFMENLVMLPFFKKTSLFSMWKKIIVHETLGPFSAKSKAVILVQVEI